MAEPEMFPTMSFRARAALFRVAAGAMPLLLLACASADVPTPPAAQAAPAAQVTTIPDPLPPQRLVGLLRQGGLIVFIRHAVTEKEGADQVSAVMGDCSTQRMLGEAGWTQAKAIGADFRRLRIPVGDVISSEYCRAWQTADLAFGRFRKSAALNFEPAEAYSDAQVAAMRARVAPLLAEAPPRGRNTVLVGHDDPFEAATGVYPEPMGVAWIVRPGGRDGFTLLGSILPDGWAALR
jgi:broad specificity phosphatase PhoE